jgi:hypothetical protein
MLPTAQAAATTAGSSVARADHAEQRECQQREQCDNMPPDTLRASNPFCKSSLVA